MVCVEPGGKFVLALAVFRYLQQGLEEEEGSCFPEQEALDGEGDAWTFLGKKLVARKR